MVAADEVKPSGVSMGVPQGVDGRAAGAGLRSYYKGKTEELEILCRDKQHNLRRLEAQRNELNTKGESRKRI